MRAAGLVGAVMATAAVAAGCADADDAAGPRADVGAADATSGSEEGGAAGAETVYPDVLDATLSPVGDQWQIAVTVSSPYDSPERFADGWRVTTVAGEVLAEHELTHDHANEQPFRRTSRPFAIPDDVDEVVVEGRDQISGYGGKTVTISVPR